MRSVPFRPAEKFLKWVEFAAEFPDLSDLNLAGAELTFIAYHSLDVLVPVAIVIVALSVTGFHMFKTICASVRAVHLRSRTLRPSKKQKIQ